MKKSCVLVSGGAGYIGSHTTVELINAGYDVVIVDNLSNSDMNAVEGLMREFGRRNIVFSSSCTVYGEPEKQPVTEQTPRKPATSPYGNTKQMCEDILRDSIAAYPGMKGIALRYFNPIGAHPSALIGELPRGVPQNLVPFITQTAAGLRECLSVFGDDYPTPDGSCIRDYIDVVDLAKAHVATSSPSGPTPRLRTPSWVGRPAGRSTRRSAPPGPGRNTCAALNNF